MQRTLFCSTCGAKLTKDGNCPNCGKANIEKAIPSSDAVSPENGASSIVHDLSKRYFIDGIIWICIGIIQLALGAIIFVSNLVTSSWNPGTVFLIFLYAVIGLLNLAAAQRQMKNSKAILKQPVGIVKANSFGPRFWIFLVYNALIVLVGISSGTPLSITFALVTIAAILADAIGLRFFVREHKDDFLDLENAYRESTVQNAQKNVVDVDPNNRFFNTYADFTLDQLKEILDNPGSYNKDAYAVAKILYEKKSQPSPQEQ